MREMSLSLWQKSNGVFCPKCGRWIDIMIMPGMTDSQALCGCGMIVLVEFFEDIRSIVRRVGKKLDEANKDPEV
jgi:hypothetical protein